eukprot:g2503.t1
MISKISKFSKLLSSYNIASAVIGTGLAVQTFRHFSTAKPKEVVVAVVAEDESPAMTNVPDLACAQFFIGSNAEALEKDLLTSKLTVEDVDILVYVPPTTPSTLQDVYQRMKNVKFVHCFFAGVDNLTNFVQDCEVEHLTNGKGAFSDSLAEYALASALFFNKKFLRCIENRKEKKWDKFVMPTLGGKTIGIVGFGSIGETCARTFQSSFQNVTILGMRRSGKSHRDCDKMFGTSHEERKEFMSKCDVIISALPGTKETRFFFSEAEFDSMKNDCIFISLGRGICVDEEALLKKLESKSFCAALDVFQVEPLPLDSKLWEQENVLITAHNADYTDIYYQSGWNVCVQNIKAYQNGQSLSDLPTTIDLVQMY